MSIGSGNADISVQVARTEPVLAETVRHWRRQSARVGMVPTMGALHAGHRALIDAARRSCDRVVVSLFVNPTQFGPSEDFADYPRRELEDLAVLSDAGADLAWIPSTEVMYPPGFDTVVRAGALGRPLEGEHRPGFFDGVATVVAKLLIQVLPDRAFFGEKDYQQLLVVTRMAADLGLPTEIVPVPTVREADGLAMSSRNVYLDPEARAAAPVLYRTMARMAARLADGASTPEIECAWGVEQLAAAGFDKVDYLEVRDPVTLEPVDRPSVPGRVLAAAWLKGTRLIDNLPVT